MDQLIQFSGFDLRNEKISIDGKNRCGNIQWVPFEEHPKGINYIPRFDENEDPIDVPYEPTSIWYDPEVDGEGLVQNPGAEGDKDAGTEDNQDQPPIDTNLDKMHADLSDAIKSVEEEEIEQGSKEDHPANSDLEKMHQALSQKIGALRGVGRKAKDKVNDVKGFLHEHPLITPAQVHGFQQLPLFVQCNVFILIFGLCFFIYRSKGTGRAFRQKNSKRND